MYNQVNHGPQPMPPAYQQCPRVPPPPPHFQQGPPGPPVQHVPTAVPPHIGLSAPHFYIRGPPGPSSTVPLNPSVQVPSSLVQNIGQSYVIPRPPLHGNSMMPQTYSSFGQNSQHSSNMGVHPHHIPPVPPPPLSHPHQDTSWAPGPLRGLPPPPPPPPSSHSQGQTMYQPPLPPCPPQPGDVQSLQCIPPPPPVPSTSGFHAPTPDGVYLHASVGNCPPPLPSSPPPILPSPPPLASPMTSASNLAVSNLPCNLHSELKSSNLFSSELKAIDSVDKVVASELSGITPSSKDSGSNREIAIANTDELSSTRNAMLDLPPPPCRPTEDKIVQKIEALCQLIAENGPGIEDKTRQDEHKNLEYAFLFGGDPGTEAAMSHEYFLWMKKKCILEHEWHDKKSESQLRPLVVDSLRQHDHLNVATECNSPPDSDMEMEDDITLSDKDQGLNHTIEGVAEDLSMKDQIHQLQNSTENSPVKDIFAGGVSCSGPLEVSKECEGPKLLFDLEHKNSAKSVTEVHSATNDSAEEAKFPQAKSAAPLADGLTQQCASDLAEANSHGDSGQFIKSGSPIRLLQDYASDDSSDYEDETCFADANVLTVSTRATSPSVPHKDSGSFLQTDIGSKSPSTAQKEYELFSRISQNDSEMSLNPVEEGKGTQTKSFARETDDGCLKHNLENLVPLNLSASIEVSKEKDSLSRADIGSGGTSRHAEQEDEKKTSKFELNPLKVDRFGRLAREGPTDSDSDDSRSRQTRRRNKRDRSWSCSRSPIERSSRRRRSPNRRKDKRSRSRSWSPRKRRSRSRSPFLRRSGECNGESVKRDKGQCFDFLRGKCYRGASCRYVHHERDKNASSRRHRNKHDLEASCSKNYRIHEGMKNISAKVSVDESDVVRSQDVLLHQNVSASYAGGEVEQRKEDSVRNPIVSATSDHDGQSVITAPVKPRSSREVASEVRETSVAREEPNTIIHDNETIQKTMDSHQQRMVGGLPSNSMDSGDALKVSGGASQDLVYSENGSSVQQQSVIAVGVLEHSDHPSQFVNASFVSDLLPDGNRSIACASMISSSRPLPDMLPSTQIQSTSGSVSQQLSLEQSPLCSQASKEMLEHSTSAGLPLHSYQLPPPPALSHSYGENPMQPQMPRDYVGIQQNTFFSYQSTSREPYIAPLHTQNPHFSVPPNSSWTSLPPPPPPRLVYSSSLNTGDPTSYVSSEFNESKLHPRTDSVSQISAGSRLPSHIQGSEYQDQAYPTMQEHSRPFMLTESFSSKPLPQGNLAGQSHAGLNIGKEDHFKQPPMHDSKFSSSPSFVSQQSQPQPFSWESGVNRLQPSSYKLPPEEHFKSASLIHPFSQKQQPMYSLQYSASDGNLSVPGETVTVSRYRPDVLDSNHSASLPDFGGSRISAHYNPYASTFEQPLSSKFSSIIFRQEKDIIHLNNYGSSSLHHTPVNEQGIYGVGSRQTASSPKATRAGGQILPRSGSDQYDPLFDSIEPSSTSLKKSNLDQKQEVTGESNISLRPKSSFKSLDVEENNKQWEVGAVASTSSQNNDEYGETADAEVGAVENESLSNPVDVANVAAGEIEIDQVKSPGKKRKSKDSRSMRLFKVSIANFVKEVLKPSWRQGNMSKVAFKTIVKKTVDKVSGAMKGHRMPKSQAKINQYIDSSQRKLTKLVMGYVDKYVKA